MGLHLARRHRHPLPVDLPAHRLGRAVRLEARLQQGRRRPQVHRFLELLPAPVRHRTEPHFLGVFKTPNPLGWAIFIAGTAATIWVFGRAVRGGTIGPGRTRHPVHGGRDLRRLPVAPRRGPRQQRRPARCADRHLHLRVRGDRAAARAGPRSGDAVRAGRSVASVLPGRLPDPADDHTGRRRLHVPDDDRHVQGPPRADLGRARPARLLVGHRPLGGQDRGHHRRHVAVDAVRVHRPAGRPREPRPGGP